MSDAVVPAAKVARRAASGGPRVSNRRRRTTAGRRVRPGLCTAAVLDVAAKVILPFTVLRRLGQIDVTTVRRVASRP